MGCLHNVRVYWETVYYTNAWVNVTVYEDWHGGGEGGQTPPPPTTTDIQYYPALITPLLGTKLKTK